MKIVSVFVGCRTTVLVNWSFFTPSITMVVTIQYKSTIWQYRLWSFQTGGTKLERFLPQNQHTQRFLLNFENWVNVEVSKSAQI